VWLVLGDKRGDNAQVEVVAEALGWPCERRYLAMREPYVVGKPRVRPSLHHIDPARSDALAPPWPDLIITSGRRPSMAALWIRKQSGGHSKVVEVGKPSGRLQWYDLVITASENAIAPYRNVATITLPLMQIEEAAIAAGKERWEKALSALPKPLVAVMVGGPTIPFVYNGEMVDRLLRVCREIVEQQGGTAYVTTSRRTPPAVVEALQAQLPNRARLFAWQPDAVDNPYHGLLALADRFVVTSDSISMAVEVAKLKKPLEVLPAPVGRLGAIDQVRRDFISWLFSQEKNSRSDAVRQAFARGLYRLRLVNQTRNFPAFYRVLHELGLAVPAGQHSTPVHRPLPDDLPEVVARIKALMAEA